MAQISQQLLPARSQVETEVPTVGVQRTTAAAFRQQDVARPEAYERHEQGRKVQICEHFLLVCGYV